LSSFEQEKRRITTIKKELGIEFRPLRETMEEAFQAMIDAKII